MAGKGRRDPLADVDKTVKTLINGRGQARKKPRYQSEDKRVKGTWDLKKETVARVRAAADELGVQQYKLVEKLINHGLDQLERGELELRPKMVMVADGFE